jgi:hypothetical protein
VPLDSVRCTKTVHLRTLHLQVSAAPFRYNSSDCLVCHRTVRCTSGATATSATDDCIVPLTALQFAVEVRAEVRGAPDSEQCLSGARRRQSSNGRNCQNPNGWVTWLAHRTVSGAPIDNSLPQRLFWWVRAINAPQPPPLQPSKHSTHCIQYKSNRLHSKDTIQGIDPLKVPNSTLAH